MFELNKIYNGDSLEVLKTFPSDSIDCVVTSPPYYALRDYGVQGQIGLEKTFHEYINKLLDLFDEVKRVLKPSGTCWVNLGDSYSRGTRDKDGKNHSLNPNSKEVYIDPKFKPDYGEQDKCLLQIPSRFSIGMTDRGWILRNELIWYKPNCMPSSVKDRFTVDFEKIFFFVKNKKYWFETQYEGFESTDKTYKSQNAKQGVYSISNGLNRAGGNMQIGRNKRCVWRVTTKPYKEAHFATYPEALIETPIRAGCPEFICDKCGKAREKIYKGGGGMTAKDLNINGSERQNNSYVINSGGQGGQARRSKLSGEKHRKFKEENPDIFMGYSDCECGSTFSGGVVLDPFFGSGTTGLVALKQNKNFIGIELNPEYIKLAEKRLEQILKQYKLTINYR